VVNERHLLQALEQELHAAFGCPPVLCGQFDIHQLVDDFLRGHSPIHDGCIGSIELGSQAVDARPCIRQLLFQRSVLFLKRLDVG